MEAADQIKRLTIYGHTSARCEKRQQMLAESISSLEKITPKESVYDRRADTYGRVHSGLHSNGRTTTTTVLRTGNLPAAHCCCSNECKQWNRGRKKPMATHFLVKLLPLRQQSQDPGLCA